MEIGSEFALFESRQQTVEQKSVYEMIKNIGQDSKFLFSGRTAIDYILQDIKVDVRTVYAPSYCCDSMLQPFIDKGLNIEFYEVVFKNGSVIYKVDFDKKIDVFLGMSYFGFYISNMDEIISIFHRKNVLVIEDITHRLFSTKNYCEKSDYLIGSIRKWLPLPSGGVAIKRNSFFKNVKLNKPPVAIINKKIEAMKKKAKYLVSRSSKIAKNEFLALYSEFNKSLSQTYKNLTIDDYSMNILLYSSVEEIKKKRLENTIYLYEQLKSSKDIQFMFDTFDPSKDCPLFVPLMVNDILRDKIRSNLIQNSVYCPIHWPPSKALNINSRIFNIYNQELSLICDQRYGISDMRYQINKLGEF
ncbi:hypothetical protein [Gracilibacillus alcaliphilus]|uniref:hypothetical protein n=1 Tax=Gracilibacillus alcaliphilus TaxID=1401441 RepID=UPI00195BD002|nr:hypothetical protein [Gracilibacillus alcaliphilus]MBM7678446.1 dTDP-4-amino-4,6-dideoxygalactose transaminase [Gracilibacillus alcaliphilus]